MKNTKYMLAITLSLIVLVVSAPGRASADTFNYTISGSGITASGVFTTAPEVSGTFLITGLAGTRNGQVMTLLAPNAFAGNDNLLYATAPLLDFAGLSYDVGGVDYNLQYDSASNPAPFGIGYGEFASTGLWVQVDFTASPVPEPSSLLLLGTGLLALTGMTVLRKRLA